MKRGAGGKYVYLGCFATAEEAALCVARVYLIYLILSRISYLISLRKRVIC